MLPEISQLHVLGGGTAERSILYRVRVYIFDASRVWSRHGKAVRCCVDDLISVRMLHVEMRMQGPFDLGRVDVADR